MADASQQARRVLWSHRVVSFFVRGLREPYWNTRCLEALVHWVKAPDWQQRVEAALVRRDWGTLDDTCSSARVPGRRSRQSKQRSELVVGSEFVANLVLLVRTAQPVIFQKVLDPITALVSASEVVAHALTQLHAGFMPMLVDRLIACQLSSKDVASRLNPQTLVNLLRLLRLLMQRAGEYARARGGPDHARLLAERTQLRALVESVIWCETRRKTPRVIVKQLGHEALKVLERRKRRNSL